MPSEPPISPFWTRMSVRRYRGMSTNRVPATSVSASRWAAAPTAPASSGTPAQAAGGVREPVMAGGQRAAQVQPAGTGEHAGHDLRAVVPAARAVPAVLAGLAPVVGAQGIRDTIPADAAAAARPVEQVPRVEAGEPCRDRPAGRSRFPCCELVQAVEGPADVLVGNEPELSAGRRAIVVCPGAHGAGRFAGQHGEPFPRSGRCPRERGVKPAFRVIPWPRVPDCGCELGQRSGTPDGAFL